MSNNDKTNLTLLPGGGKPDAAREALRELKAGLDAHLELQVVVARIQRSKYNALIDVGFTEAQALELCRSIMI